MNDQFSRRDALKSLLCAGTIAMIEPAYADAPESSLSIGSAPVEVTITAVSQHTVRVTIQPVRDGKPQPLETGGALLEREWGPALAKVRSLPTPRTLTSGEMTVTVSP